MSYSRGHWLHNLKSHVEISAKVASILEEVLSGYIPDVK